MPVVSLWDVQLAEQTDGQTHTCIQTHQHK